MHPLALGPPEVPVQACPRKPGKRGCREKLDHRKDFLEASLGRVQVGCLGQGEGQPSEVRWEDRVPAASTPFAGPETAPSPLPGVTGTLCQVPTPFTSQQLIPS